MQNEVEFIRNADADRGNVGIGWDATLLRVNGHELRCWHVVGSPEVLTVTTADYLSRMHHFPGSGALTPATLVDWARGSAELTARLPELLAEQAQRRTERREQAEREQAHADGKRDADRRVKLITYVKLTRDPGEVVELVGQHYEVGPYLAIYTNGRCTGQGGASTRAGANRKVRAQARALVGQGFTQQNLVRTPYAD